jgi:hypothetical protein
MSEQSGIIKPIESEITESSTNTNFQQWMSWLPYRWRTQQSAISNANCRLWVIRILNAYGTDWLSSQYACFSVFLINAQYLNASESKTLLLNMRARCLYGWPMVTLNAAVTFSELIVSRTGITECSEFCNSFLSEVKWDYPLNLSISLSGGKENNYDYPSSGERSGKSPKWKSSSKDVEL